jgi:DNA-directed RNA polymerase subunit RPC12/RpoP
MYCVDKALEFQTARRRCVARGKERSTSFVCSHCRNLVLTQTWVSGVQNRNHCPYCLHSRHLDLDQPGDRLSACKGIMRPIGVTLKKTHKKYGARNAGELMLIHQCQECGKLSINRIAADDDPQAILAVFIASLSLDPARQTLLAHSGIQLLNEQDMPVLRRGLFGAIEKTFNRD